MCYYRHVNLALLSYSYNNVGKTTPHCSICDIVHGCHVCSAVLCVLLIRGHMIIICKVSSKAAFVQETCRSCRRHRRVARDTAWTKGSFRRARGAARRGRRYESLYCICTATNRHRYGVTSAYNQMAGKRDTWSKVEVCSVIAVCVWEYSAVHVIKLELMLDQQRSWIPNTSTTHDKRRADVLTRR